MVGHVTNQWAPGGARGIKGGVGSDESSLKGMEATIWPEFPEAAEVGSIVVNVGAREDLDFIMGMGEG